MAKRNDIEQHRPQLDFPVTSVEDFKNVVLTPDIAEFKLKLEEKYFNEYKLAMPGYVLKALVKAMSADISEKTLLLEKARQSAELHYLASWSKGDIKIKDAEAKPMPEEVKQELKEIKIAKKAIKDKEIELIKSIKKKSLPKEPVHESKTLQDGYCAKYKWIVPNTFKQDPHKPGGTIVDIKCTSCKSRRTVHLSDSWQVKLCTSCKGKNDSRPKQMGKQSSSKSNSKRSTKS